MKTFLSVVSTATLFVVGCSKPAPQLAPPEAPLVTWVHPVSLELPNYIEVTGRLVPLNTVEIRPRVAGYVTKVNFVSEDAKITAEGKDVKEGDVLYEIDSIPYLAEVNRTKAEVARANITIVKAEQDLDRAVRGATTGAVTPQDLDTAKSTLDLAKAALESAKSTLVKAEDDLKNCTIKAPISGRLSRNLVNKGNLVQSGTLLNRITTVDPIYAVWDVDETTSLWYRDQILNLKKIPDPNLQRLKAKIQLLNLPAEAKARMGWMDGEVDFIEPQIDRSTGSRYIRAIFKNPMGFMTPGDSIAARVEAGLPSPRILIPELAVASQQRVKYVLVLNDKDEAEFRPVELGQVRDGMQIIDKGLAVTDRVIVTNLLRVRPGMKVNAKPAKESSTAPKDTPKK